MLLMLAGPSFYLDHQGRLERLCASTASSALLAARSAAV